MSGLVALPPELLEHIASQADYLRDVSSLVRTSRMIYDILNAKLYHLDSCGLFPRALAWASLHGRYTTFDLALKAGSDVDSIYANMTTVDSVSGQSRKIQSIIRYDATPLLCAAANGDITLVNRLLDAGADPLWRDERGQTALHLAAEQGHVNVATMLMQRFPSLLSVEGGDDGNLPVIGAAPHKPLFRQMLAAMDLDLCITSVEAAARLGYEDIFHWLVKRAAQMGFDHLNDVETDILHEVCYGSDESHVRIAEFLIKAGAETESLSEVEAYEGMNLLQVVCTANNPNVVDMAKLLLEHGVDPTSVAAAENEKSSIQIACSTGNFNLVRLLLVFITSTETDYECEGGEEGHEEACQSGDITCVKVIFDAFPLKSLDSERGTRCLSGACKSGNLKLVQMLLDNGATANHPGDDPFGPLGYAWQAGNLDILRLLIDAGVVPNKGQYVRRPLLLHSPWPDVSDELQLACFQLLVNAGANPLGSGPTNDKALKGACRVGAASCVRLLFEKYGLKLPPRKDGHTSCLHLAVDRGSLETVKILLENGADVNATDVDNLTPLHHAARLADKGKREALIACLLNHGADADARAEVPSLTNASPLCHLIYNSTFFRPLRDGLDEHSPAVRLLIDHGAKDLDMALYVACRTSSYFAARDLLESGANPNTNLGPGLSSVAQVLPHSVVPPIKLLMSSRIERKEPKALLV